MQIDPEKQLQKDNYKLLTNFVVPRPIAWVTSVGEQGVVNLAPFSFFNGIGSDPLLIMLSIAKNSQGLLKDTGRNILWKKEFVVNFVTEDLLNEMNLSAADFPPDESELVATGLATVDSVKIGVPRVARAKVQFECRLYQEVPIGAYTMIIGEVVMFHVADELIDAKLHINGFAPIGRLGSPSMYCRTTDRFDLPRAVYAQGISKNV